MRVIQILTLAAIITWTIQAIGQELPTNYQSFSHATPKEIVTPNYPKAEQSKLGEGWVDISFVVSDTGEVMDPVVVDSSGSAYFETAAIAAIKKTEFNPALENGFPIQQCKNSFRYRFMMANAPKGASRKFVRTYKKAFKALQSNDIELAETLIQELYSKGVRNNYEDAYYWFIKSLLAAAKSEYRDQLAYLSRALANNDLYLPEGIYQPALITSFQLQNYYAKYSDALESYEKLQKKVPENEISEQIRQASSRINEIVNSDVPLQFTDSFSASRLTVANLYRPQFSITLDEGNIDTIEIRCDKQYRRFDFADNMVYEVPRNWGNCKLHLAGDEGTQFSLLQLTAFKDSSVQTH